MATTIVTKSGSGAPTASNLVAGELAVDLTNKRLYTENSSGTVLELGTNPASDVTFGDNTKAVFGDGSDLRIYHTGSHSTIENIGTGHLQIHTTDFRLKDSAGTESMILANADGNVQLYYDNALKLATTATGIDVTGTVTADGLTVQTTGSTTAVLTLNNADGNGTLSQINLGYTADPDHGNIQYTGDMIFTAAAAERMRIDSSGNVGIGATPSAWRTAFVDKAIDLGTHSALYDQFGGSTFLANNFYRSNDNSFKYKTTAGATAISLDAGSLSFSNAPSGTAGTTATLTNRMILDASGNLGIGTTTPDARLDVTRSGNGEIAVLQTSANRGFSFQSQSDTALQIASVQGSTNLDLWANTLSFSAGAAERMRIDSSGNLGIGSSLPSEKVTLAQSVPSTYTAGLSTLANPAGTHVRIENNSSVTDTFVGVTFVPTNGAAQQQLAYMGAVSTGSGLAPDIVFGRRAASTYYVESMRIDASGNLLVGTTTTPSLAGLAVGSTAAGKNISVFSSANGTNGLIGIYQSNGTQEGQLYAGTGDVNLFGTSVVKVVASSGGVQLTSGATSWTSISDERAKDIIEPISNAVQKVSNLRSVIGKYKTDSEGTRRSFLIAQDVQAVFPEAVDTTDEDNLGVRYTETIPLLVAAMKEQQATIESLEARIAALES